MNNSWEEQVNLHSLNESIADVERNVKARRILHSKIPSIFDHSILNSSILESNYHRVTTDLSFVAVRAGPSAGQTRARADLG
jgi:hypothetical protein